METPVALNISPLNAPHKELEWLPLADRDFHMTETIELDSQYHITVLNELRAKHMNGTDILRIWDSHLPIFYIPPGQCFP